MLENVFDFQKTSMFLSDTSEDIDAHFRNIASKKTSKFFEVDAPSEGSFALFLGFSLRSDKYRLARELTAFN